MKQTMKINDDETYILLWWNCCETVSKRLACMKGCWDPEFKPSVEEIVDYRWYNMAILSVRFFWWAHTWGGGGFPYTVWHMAGAPVEVASRSLNQLKPCAPIYAHTENAQFVEVS